jgi:hypothetical protein
MVAEVLLGAAKTCRARVPTTSAKKYINEILSYGITQMQLENITLGLNGVAQVEACPLICLASMRP